MTLSHYIRLLAAALLFGSPIALLAAPTALPARLAGQASPEELRDALLAALVGGTTVVSSYVGTSHPGPMWSANVSLRQTPSPTGYSGVCAVNQIDISADADEERRETSPSQEQSAEPGLKLQSVRTSELFRIVGQVPGVSLEAISKQDSVAAQELQPDCSKVDPQATFFRVDDWLSGHGGADGAATTAYLLQEAFNRKAESDIPFESSCGKENCLLDFHKLDTGRITEVSLGECRKDGELEPIKHCTEYRIKFFENISPSGLSGEDSNVVLWAKQQDSSEEPKLTMIYFSRGQWVS